MTISLHVLSPKTLTDLRPNATFHALHNAPNLRHERDLDVLDMGDIQGSVIRGIQRHTAMLTAWNPTDPDHVALRAQALRIDEQIMEALHDYADDVPYTLSTLYLTYAHPGSDYGATFPDPAAATHFMECLQRACNESPLPYAVIPSIDDQPVRSLADILDTNGWSLRCVVQPALHPFRPFPIPASIPAPDNIPF